MLIDKLAVINNYNDNVQIKNSKINGVSDEKNTINDLEDYKLINNKEPIKQEVKLDNRHFGFDRETKEFFVKVETIDGKTYQYPTEEAIKLKAHFKKLNNEFIQ